MDYLQDREHNTDEKSFPHELLKKFALFKPQLNKPKPLPARGNGLGRWFTQKRYLRLKNPSLLVT